jgi:hypothetical protein
MITYDRLNATCAPVLRRRCSIRAYAVNRTYPVRNNGDKTCDRCFGNVPCMLPDSDLNRSVGPPLMADTLLDDPPFPDDDDDDEAIIDGSGMQKTSLYSHDPFLAMLIPSEIHRSHKSQRPAAAAVLSSLLRILLLGIVVEDNDCGVFGVTGLTT